VKLLGRRNNLCTTFAHDAKNGELYARYKALADAEENVIFGGRLAEYKYYDMDDVIESALLTAERELQ